MACLSDYFSSYTVRQLSRIRLIVCGMNSSFISAARKFFPSAVTGIEPCRISRRLNAAMDRIRVRALSAPATQEPGPSWKNRLFLKENARFLRIKPSSGKTPVPQNADTRERLSHVLEVFPDISEMYTLLLEYSAIIASDRPYTARQDLDRWLEHASSSTVPEIRDAASAVRYWRGYILNGIKSKSYSGSCTKIISTIETFMRIQGGPYSFEDMRNRLLLICGTVHPADPPEDTVGSFRPPYGGEN